eukprot:UN23354
MYTSMGDYGQSSWAGGCLNTTALNGTDIDIRIKNNSDGPFDWTSVISLDEKGVMFRQDTTLSAAKTTCAEMNNCTYFGFNDPTHAPDQKISVAFYDYRQIVDTESISSSWYYLKNSTRLPYCDATLYPPFAPEKRSSILTLSWQYCENRYPGSENNFVVQ